MLPLLGLSMMHLFGPFLWGEFFREFLWLLSISFLLQFGSVQMMGVSSFSHTLEDEVREGLQSRFILLVAACLFLFLLPVSLFHAFILAAFLVLRFTGDTLTAVQKLNGNERKAAAAETGFWLLLIAGIVINQDKLSSLVLMKSASLAAAVRVLLADPRGFGNALQLQNHAPDFHWMREAFRKFIPQLLGFLFYTLDLILASILLPVFEFAAYQVTVAFTVMTGLLYNSLYVAGSRSRSLQSIITTTSLVMIPVVLLLKFILEEFAGVPLTPLYLLAAYFMLVPGAVSFYFIRWLLEDREGKIIQQLLGAVCILHILVLPQLFAEKSLQEYLLYMGGIYLLLCLALTLVSYRKGYK